MLDESCETSAPSRIAAPLSRSSAMSSPPRSCAAGLAGTGMEMELANSYRGVGATDWIVCEAAHPAHTPFCCVLPLHRDFVAPLAPSLIAADEEVCASRRLVVVRTWEA